MPQLSATPQAYISAGKITASAGTAAALTSNDGSATLTRTAAGDYTVTFGQPFLSAPVVTATVFDATFATTAHHTMAIVAVSASAVQFNLISNVTTGTVTALADAGDIHFIAYGVRNL